MTEKLGENDAPRPMDQPGGPLSGGIGHSSPAVSSIFDPLGSASTLAVKPPSRLQKSSPGGSEALVSSDEESDAHQPSYVGARVNGGGGLMPGNLPSRRPSYAAEFASRQRTFSTTGLNGGPLSPATSHPTTPSGAGETSVWAAGITGAGSTFTWASSSSIWKEPTRKSPPKSLNVQGPNSGASATSPLFANSEALPSPTTTLGMGAPDIPIPVPLHPQFRSYRSLSYSAGQPDPEGDGNRPRLSPSNIQSGRHHSVLQHRPSRPSLLSEQHDAHSPLRSVNEHEDDSVPPRFNEVPMAAPSAYLQQASAASLAARQPRLEALSRFRNRSASMATPGMIPGMMAGDFDESAFIEDDEELEIYQRRLGAGRSMSVMHPTTNPMLDQIRRQHWGGLEGPQSRRHSFNVAPGLSEAGESDYDSFGQNSVASSRFVDNASSASGLSRDRFYMTEEPQQLRTRQSFSSQSIGPLDTSHQLQVQAPLYAQNRLHITQPSPPPGAIGRSLGAMPHAAVRSHQVLYMVSFKACRTDVFYVQEGTGLRIKQGDLVIVEADRGTDLGTVVAENVTWQQAKDLKEQYQQEHYKWLMVYARRNAPAPAANAILANGMAGNQMGNAAMNQGQPGQDGAAVMELKPKMIKRLAQVHEIQTLREKEANEAKAKRLCQQKVLEHRLPMEILDAEFQMDWKKLTFYYFADSYINFNSLVTDLFKVYKTRIWMSAMNPAAFSHTTPGPTAGLPAPNPLLGAIGDPPTDHQHGPAAAYMQHQPMFGALSQAYTQTQVQVPSTAAPRPNFPPVIHAPALGVPDYARQAQLGLQQPQTLNHQPHNDFSHLPQQQQNGYINHYNPNQAQQQADMHSQEHWLASSMANLTMHSQ